MSKYTRNHMTIYLTINRSRKGFLLEATPYGVDIFRLVRDEDGDNEIYLHSIVDEIKMTAAYWMYKGTEYLYQNKDTL
jgi:hypothetical protein